LCFNNAPGNKKEFNFSKKDEKENDDFSLLIGDKKKNDLTSEMTKIDEIQGRRPMGGKNQSKGQS